MTKQDLVCGGKIFFLYWVQYLRPINHTDNSGRKGLFYILLGASQKSENSKKLLVLGTYISF